MTTIVNKMKLVAMTLIAAMLAVTFGGSASAAETAVIGIEFEQPGNAHLYVEQDTKQLKVFAELSGQTAKEDVTEEAYWVSSQPSVIKVEKGLLTPLKNGTAQISAKYSGKTITLTATADYLFESMELMTPTTNSPDTVDIELGQSLQLDARTIDADDNAYIVSDKATWTTSDSRIVTVDKGKLTPVGKGSATVSAKYKGLSATVTVKVASPYSSLKIETAPEQSLDLLVGQASVQLRAKAVPTAAGADIDVTGEAAWSSSNANVVAVENGALTAKAQGTAKITAAYLGVTNSVTVIVRLPYQALKLTPDKDMYLFVNDPSVLVTAKVLKDALSGDDVTTLGTWTSSNPVAVAVSVAPEGASVSPKAAGSSIVKFEHRGLSEELRVTVYPTITGIEPETDKIDMFKDEALSLPDAAGRALFGELIDVSGLLEWTSGNPSVVAIEDGKITALKPGSAVLTAKVRNFTTTVEVTVQEKVLVLIPEKNTMSLVVGKESGYPKVRAVLEDGTELEDISGQIEWKSSSSSLLLKETAMKALLAGRATLTGTYLNEKLTISVMLEPEIAKFIITEEVDVNPGRTKLINVKGVYKDGKTVSLSSKIEWTSSNDEIATIERSTVRALTEGQVSLTASYQDKPLKVTVRVVPKLKKLTADSTSLTLKAGTTAKVALTALYDTGREDTVTSSAKWSTSNKTVAAADANGTIRAVKKGNATIKASYQNRTIYVRVKVE